MAALLLLLTATGQMPVLNNPPATLTLTIAGVGPYSGTHTLSRTATSETEVNYGKKFPNGAAVQVDFHRYVATGPVWIEAFLSGDLAAEWRVNTGSASLSSVSGTLPWYRSLTDLPPGSPASVGP